jgi:hypothetical protein
MLKGKHKNDFKVSLGPAMPYPSTPCFRGGCLQGMRPTSVFYPYGYRALRAARPRTPLPVNKQTSQMVVIRSA